MAEMGWTARVATAAGAAAGTGAAQLGLGYGLGVVVWPATGTPDDSLWLGSLGWATWITASATVLGAVIASRLGGGPRRRPGGPARLSGPWRLALAAAAAIGALVAVALIALPARSAVRGDTFSPQVIAAGYAILGVLLGLVVAYWAVVSRPVAANLITTGLWLWALAISAVLVDLITHRSSATYLTSWQFTGRTGHLYGTIFWPSAVLTLAAAFVIGVVAVAPAARRGQFGLGAATSGAVGPLLVAAAFFVLAPQLTSAAGQLESAYLIAPYAVIAGMAGSALTVSLLQTIQTRRAPARRALPAAAFPATGHPDPAIENHPHHGDGQPPADAERAPLSNQQGRPASQLAVTDHRSRPDDQPTVSEGRGRPDDRNAVSERRGRRNQQLPAAASGGPAAVTGLGRDDRRTPSTGDGPAAARQAGRRGGQPAPEAAGSPSAPTGVATVPAADPASFPPAPVEQKTKVSRFFGRQRGAQPTPEAESTPDTKRPAGPQGAPERDDVPAPSGWRRRREERIAKLDSTRPAKPVAGPPAPTKQPPSTEAATTEAATKKPQVKEASSQKATARKMAADEAPAGEVPTNEASAKKKSGLSRFFSRSKNTDAAGQEVPETAAAADSAPGESTPATTDSARPAPQPRPSSSGLARPVGASLPTGQPAPPDEPKRPATVPSPAKPSKPSPGGSSRPTTQPSAAAQPKPSAGSEAGDRPGRGSEPPVPRKPPAPSLTPFAAETQPAAKGSAAPALGGPLAKPVPSGKPSASYEPRPVGGGDSASGRAAMATPAEDAADPEIAAAARPRGRAKKAATPPRKAPETGNKPQSTVTPPPDSPTVARINPKAPKD